MKIVISDEARQWYEDELNLKPGDALRFFGKVYGKTAVHEGMSLGIAKSVPKEIAASVVINGVTYFVEKNDAWFFSDYDLDVGFNEQLKEPKYNFI